MRPALRQVLPPMLQDMLNPTAEQKSQVGDLQKEGTARLAKILAPEQMKEMQNMSNQGPRGGPPPTEGSR